MIPQSNSVPNSASNRRRALILIFLDCTLTLQRCQKFAYLSYRIGKFGVLSKIGKLCPNSHL
jgi:hypothetical protein